jgi:hypothetical protein
MLKIKRIFFLSVLLFGPWPLSAHSPKSGEPPPTPPFRPLSHLAPNPPARLSSARPTGPTQARSPARQCPSEPVLPPTSYSAGTPPVLGVRARHDCLLRAHKSRGRAARVPCTSPCHPRLCPSAPPARPPPPQPSSRTLTPGASRRHQQFSDVEPRLLCRFPSPEVRRSTPIRGAPSRPPWPTAGPPLFEFRPPLLVNAARESSFAIPFLSSASRAIHPSP